MQNVIKALKRPTRKNTGKIDLFVETFGFVKDKMSGNHLCLPS
jgi:hypothetical protein